MAAYQKRNTGVSESQIAMLRRLTLSDAEFAALAAYAKKRSIIFFSTAAGGFRSVDVLQKIGVPAFKFGSSDLDNLPLLDYAARLRKTDAYPTGMGICARPQKPLRLFAREAIKNSRLPSTTDYPADFARKRICAPCPLWKNVQIVPGFPTTRSARRHPWRSRWRTDA
jgi:sialic acid synthase SpsE